MTLKMSMIILLFCLVSSSGFTAPATIDPNVVVRIGGHEVSHYVLEKYYGRFSEATVRQTGHLPAPAENRAWLELFFAQQVVIADAKKRGFAKRSDVRRTVDLMERYMLTQPAGPFYESLYSTFPARAEDPRVTYERSNHILTVAIVRFDHELDGNRALGSDFLDQSLEEKERRVNQHRNSEHGDVFEGALSWPYSPWLELMDIVSKPEVGRWIRWSAPYGCYFVCVRAEQNFPHPDFEVVKAEFLGQLAQVDRLRIQRIHRAESLSKSVCRLEFENVNRAFARLAALPANSASIPAHCFAQMENIELIKAVVAGQPIGITVAQYTDHFNEQYLRKLPSDLVQFRKDLEDIIVEKMDFESACELGLQRQPQFIEDRRGFFDMQVLAAAENETLAASSSVELGEIESYYEKNKRDFVRPFRISGRLATFKDACEMAAWSSLGAPARKEDENITVDWGQPAAGFEALEEGIFRASPGARFGPIPRNGKLIVFVRGETVETAPSPLAQVEPYIRSILRRRHLDEREIAIAKELCRQFQTEDRLDYARYGLIASEIRMPWMQ